MIYQLLGILPGTKDIAHQCRKCATVYGIFGSLLLMTAMLSGCEKVQQIVAPQQVSADNACTNGTRVLNVGFYAYYAPVSYSADEDTASEEFNTHLGYEAALLTALEAMEDAGLSFARRAIATWEGIWLKAAEPQYDLIGGGITMLDSRTRNAAGTQVVTFTSGHIKFRQSLLVRAEDAERLSTYAALSSDVRVGVLSGTTGEARLLELTGLADANGVLAEGTRIETPQGTLVADGTADYMSTAADTSPNLARRQHLYPPSENMPQVIYLGDEVGEAELFEALATRHIDAVASGEPGNRDVAHAADGTFVVTALDAQVEYGGFTLALEDAELATCIDEKINYLTDDRNIGYGEWLQDPSVFMNRAQMWNAENEGYQLPR